MREKSAARYTVATMILILCGLASPPMARAQSGGADAGAKNLPDFSARAQAVRKSARTRSPTRILVTPRYPYRLVSTPYPVPYDIEYPGPNAVRQCTGWLALEHRASGTVLVPRERCWWETR